MEPELIAMFGTVGKGIEGLGTKFSALDQAVAHLQETVSKRTDAAPKLEPEKVPVAEMGRGGALAGITEFRFWDVPIGAALVSGLVAVFGTEFVDGVMAAQDVKLRGAVKLLASGATVKWGGALGPTGKLILAGLLGFDGLKDLLGIDQWAKGWATRATGVVTQRGLAGINDSRAVREAEEVAGYASVGGFYPGINRRSG